MPKVMIEIPEGVDEAKLRFWIAEGKGRENFSKSLLWTLSNQEWIWIRKELSKNLTSQEVKCGLKSKRGTLRKV